MKYVPQKNTILERLRSNKRDQWLGYFHSKRINIFTIVLEDLERDQNNYCLPENELKLIKRCIDWSDDHRKSNITRIFRYNIHMLFKELLAVHSKNLRIASLEDPNIASVAYSPDYDVFLSCLSDIKVEDISSDNFLLYKALYNENNNSKNVSVICNSNKDYCFIFYRIVENGGKYITADEWERNHPFT